MIVHACAYTTNSLPISKQYNGKSLKLTQIIITDVLRLKPVTKTRMGLPDRYAAICSLRLPAYVESEEMKRQSNQRTEQNLILAAALVVLTTALGRLVTD